MATPHSGQYTRKVIVDKYPPAFADKVTEFKDPAGLKYELTLTLPQDQLIFNEYYDTQFYKQAGEAFTWRPSPWRYADGSERRRTAISKLK